MNHYVATVLLLTLCCGSNSLAQFSSFHIGNSLTWDMQPREFNDETTNVTTGYHIRCASALSEILADPNWTCVQLTAFGNYIDALPNYQWDAITLQPYTGFTSKQELQSFATLANMTSNDTDVFMYATWPWKDDISEGFNEEWYGTSVAFDLDSPMIHRRSWYESAMNHVRAELPTRTVSLIPVGDVFARLEAAFETGAYPGFDSADVLYRDGRHASYDVGRYTANLTAWTVMHQADPRFRGPVDWPSSIPEPVDELIRETIWDVVINDPFTGVEFSVADFNKDSVVDLADYTIWRNTLGSSGLQPYALADANGDGAVDAADYAVWKQEFGFANPSIAAVSINNSNQVPEPRPLITAILSIVLYKYTRWRDSK